MMREEADTSFVCARASRRFMRFGAGASSQHFAQIIQMKMRRRRGPRVISDDISDAGRGEEATNEADERLVSMITATGAED